MSDVSSTRKRTVCIRIVLEPEYLIIISFSWIFFFLFYSNSPCSPRSRTLCYTIISDKTLNSWKMFIQNFSERQIKLCVSLRAT